LKWTAYAAALLAAHAIGVKRGPNWGISLVFASATAASLATVAHGVLGARLVYGLYEPRFEVTPWHVGPLLNPNNLSGYLALGTLCGLGMMADRRSELPRWAAGMGVAVTLAANVTAASRGGTLALLFGIVALGAILLATRHLRRASRSIGLLSVLIAIGGGATWAYLSASPATWTELGSRNLEKLSLLRPVVSLVRSHPWFGVGRGSFESVFPAYGGSPGGVVYAHAENFVAEWIAGWGVPVGASALVGFAWCLRPSRLDAFRSASTTGAWVGCGALLAQNLVDLALEVPAVSIALCVVFGSLLGGTGRRRGPTSSVSLGSTHRWVRWSVVAPALLLAGATLRWGWSDVGSERASFHERVQKPGGDSAARARLRADLRAAMLRHPAEPYLPFVGALIAWTTSDGDPLPWLARALERDVTSGQAHLLVAEVLVRRGGTGQALLELRLAVEGNPALAPAASARALRWTTSCDDLERTVPMGSRGAAMLRSLGAQLTDPDRLLCRLRLLRLAIERDPREPGPHALAADVLLELLARGRADPTCGGELRSACEAAVEKHAGAVELALPDTSDALRIGARLRSQRGEKGEAERQLSERCFVTKDREKCLLLRAQLALELGAADRYLPAVKDYLAVSCASRDGCAQANDAVGSMFAARGDWGNAASHFARAASEAPSEARWLAVADAAGRSGSHGQALDALQKLAKLRGSSDPALDARMEAERQSVLERLRR